MVENDMQQIQQEKKYIFRDHNLVFFDKHETTAITTLDNVNLNYTRFHIYNLNEFLNMFYLDVAKNEYIYRLNTKIKYSKEIVEAAITSVVSFIYNKSMKFSKVIDDNLIDFYVPAEEEAPLIIVFGNPYNSWCLLIAPRIAGD